MSSIKFIFVVFSILMFVFLGNDNRDRTETNTTDSTGEIKFNAKAGAFHQGLQDTTLFQCIDLLVIEAYTVVGARIADYEQMRRDPSNNKIAAQLDLLIDYEETKLKIFDDYAIQRVLNPKSIYYLKIKKNERK